MNAESKILAVVGGSSGIGASIARLGAQRGYRVAIGFHTQKHAADKIVLEASATDRDVCCFAIDVRDPGSVDAFFESVIARYGIPNSVALCAGASGRRAKLLDLAAQEINDLVATNLTGAFFCVQAASRKMAVSNGGRGGAIVALSSEAGRFGGNLISPYAAGKAGINAMVIGVARELAAENIRLNAVSPGIIATERLATDPSTHADSSVVPSIPAGRLGRPDEVANAVLWLLSNEASYVTGSILTVAGGR